MNWRCNLEEDKLGLDVGEERGQGCFKGRGLSDKVDGHLPGWIEEKGDQR